MTIGLTKRQADALRFIRGYQLVHNGVSPSYDEIAAAIGYRSRGCVTEVMRVLERRRRIRRLHTRARAIEVLTDIPIPRSPTGEPLYFLPAPEPLP
jgi:repressor LexA